MRRKDRELTLNCALAVADKCEWAALSMTDAVGKPYCVPLSIVREGMKIYFHSARDGQKLSCLRQKPSVCLACVGDALSVPAEFTIEYESAIILGEAAEIVSDDEKIHALSLLCKRHTPSNMEAFDSVIAQSLAYTSVWAVKITGITGKSNKRKIGAE